MENREAFENFILNNRIDQPKYSLRIDKVTETYEDPRLAVAYRCWCEAVNQAEPLVIPKIAGDVKVIRRIVIEITDKEIHQSKNVKSNVSIIKDGNDVELFDCQVSRPAAHCIGRAHSRLIGNSSVRVAKLILKSIT